MSRLRIPSATYRLQFSGQFRFEQARALAGSRATTPALPQQGSAHLLSKVCSF
jgi:maltooligosyltrehalose synthase